MPPENAIERSELREEYTQFVGRKLLVMLASLLGIVLLMGIATTLGSADISPAEAYSAILARFLPGQFQTTEFIDTIVWQLRLHRVLMAIFAGMNEHYAVDDGASSPVRLHQSNQTTPRRRR